MLATRCEKGQFTATNVHSALLAFTKERVGDAWAASGEVATGPISYERMSLRVHYLRHGESEWNSQQSAARKGGMTQQEVRLLANEVRFTDSPLGTKGVQQALALWEVHAAGGEGATNGSLSSLLHCAAAGSCPAPTLFVSNLRRAIDTGLFATRSLLDAQPQTRVHVLPALQETCHHADCTPLPLGDDGRIEPPPATVDAVSARAPLTTAVLAAQATALRAVASVVDAEWLRLHGYPRLQLHQSRLFDDRRRVPDGLPLRTASGLGDAAFANALEPLAQRLGDILSAALGSAAEAAPGTRHPVVLTAHSRLLREFVYAFHSNRLSAPVLGRAGVALGLTRAGVALRWGEGNSADCTSLGEDETKLNNCGSVSFDLDLDPGGGTLTLRRCTLGAGSSVLARSAPALAVVSPPKVASAADGWAATVASRGLVAASVGSSGVFAAALLLLAMILILVLLGRQAKRVPRKVS